MKRPAKKVILSVVLAVLIIVVGRGTGQIVQAPSGFDPGELYRIRV